MSRTAAISLDLISLVVINGIQLADIFGGLGLHWSMNVVLLLLSVVLFLDATREANR